MVKALRQRRVDLHVEPKAFKRASPQSKTKSDAFRFQTVDTSVKTNGPQNVGQKLQSSPLRAHFKSKAELEQTRGNEERLQSYNMFWHFQEFDPIDLDEEMDIDDKF